MVIRSFLPVGQGAFYKETFYSDGLDKPISIVYDCGSSTGLDYIEKNIKNNFDKKDDIKAVFISHFDEDHINGLEWLLRYCNVKYLFSVSPLFSPSTMR